MSEATVRLGDVCEVERGQVITQKQTTPGEIPVVAGGMEPSYTHGLANIGPEVITVSGSGASAGYVAYWDEPIWASDCSTIRPASEEVDLRFMYLQLKAMEPFIQESLRRGAAQPHVYAKDLAELPVVVPSIEEQRQVASVLDATEALLLRRREALAKIDTAGKAIFIKMFGDGTTWEGQDHVYSLGKLEELGLVQLGRGKVISRKDIEADPGDYPIYSSAGRQNGEFGRYGKFMFDEELVTWSVDGGGHLFYRPPHRFSVTNVGGWIRVLDKSRLCTRYLHMALVLLHSRLTFDWTQKAHSSVIRRLYAHVLVPPMREQELLIERLSVLDELEQQMQTWGRGVERLNKSLQRLMFPGVL